MGGREAIYWIEKTAEEVRTINTAVEILLNGATSRLAHLEKIAIRNLS